MSTPSLPHWAWIEQHFDPACITDIDGEVTRQIQALTLSARVRPGQTVAVTAGSRGIAEIGTILAVLIRNLKEQGLKPFIVPAMGSHGGATAQGQMNVLASYGITEQAMDAPIWASMQTEPLGYTDLGTPVHLDHMALTADHIVVVNRIKAHTKFKAEIESGLMKMLAVGLGKHTGASLVHTLAPVYGLGRLIEHTARYILDHRSVLMGLGIVENALGQCAKIQAIFPEKLEKEEKKLLVLAKRRSAKIPFSDLDVLIVDCIGKDISGTGMDTNVTGRNRDILGDFCTTPRVKRIVVRDLTAATEGNALGLGFADFCTTRAVQAMDTKKTYTNAMTGVSPEKAAIPMHFDADRETIQAALDSLGQWAPDRVRVLRIQDTLHLTRMQASAALLADLPEHCSVQGQAQEMLFDENGNLTDEHLGGSIS
ncbi:MAG: lactate racemase domain-containing protein [Thermodesulfobacteriota bacterium]